MCVYSAVIDSVRDQAWREPFNRTQWDWSAYQLLQEVLKRLDKIDKHLGLKDCVDDRKDVFMQELKELIEKHHGPQPTASVTVTGTPPAGSYSAIGVPWDAQSFTLGPDGSIK